MRGALTAALRWVVVGLTAVLAIWILVTVPNRAVVDGVDGIWLLSWLGLLVVGGYLVARRPGNRLSWLLVAVAVLVSSAAIAEDRVYALSEGWGLLVAMMSNLLIGGFVLIPLILLWYPTGRVASPRWLWLEKALIGLGILLSAYYMLRPGRLGITDYVNPLGVGFLAPLRDSLAEQGAGVLVVVLGVFAFVSLVARWRRSRGQERSQLKLVAVAVTVTLAWFGLTLALGLLFDIENPFVETMQVIVFVLGVNGLAIAIAMAVVRYRLYEIDRVVSKTVAYVLVIGLLGAVFFTAITLLTSILPADSELAVAGSTLVVAALFTPLRKRVQRRVDRRFNRSRYDAERVMATFSERLREQLDGEALIAGLVAAVGETMQPSLIGVWVREAP